VYGAVIWLRNKCFDWNILKSASFNFPLICVGNLATGGTGKTPMTEYLVDILKDNYKTGTLSRGYKRKTKGFAIADDTTTAIDIGDEPMQFHQKFPTVAVAVGEERLVAIPQLLHQRPGLQVIVLDDAFQHRTVRAGLNILLTEYKNLYTRDLMLPAGDLRDVKSSSKRADVIIVTKCKSDLPDFEKASLIEEIAPLPHQKVFFTEIVYAQPYHLFNKTKGNIGTASEILLLCGIANPKPLMEVLTRHVSSYDMIRYADHHIFNTDDLKEIQKHYERLQPDNRLILTTEKDGVRLEKFHRELSGYPIYVLPIRHRFLFNEQTTFDKIVLDFVQSFQA
jgi:tetraacyldisaccharide 4'-kinase